MDPNSAEVATDVFLYIRAFPNLDYPCLVVVPQGGAVVPRQRFYRPLPHRFRASCWKYALEAIINRLLLYFLVHDNRLLSMLELY